MPPSDFGVLENVQSIIQQITTFKVTQSVNCSAIA